MSSNTPPYRTLPCTPHFSRWISKPAIERRAKQAGLATEVCCHTFRATGITAYLTNGGDLKEAKKIASHESTRTTQLYNRSEDKVFLDEIEKIQI